MNWDSAEERFNLIERVGHEEYNRLLTEHQVNTTVNRIRPVASRFGLLYMVTGTKLAFSTRQQAEAYVRDHVEAT